MNERLIVVEYQADGSSATVLKQYFQRPRGFRARREVNIRHAIRAGYRIKNIIHYGFLSIVARSWGYPMRSPTPLWSLLILPASAALYLWLRARLAVP